jgi:hypothetical protein
LIESRCGKFVLNAGSRRSQAGDTAYVPFFSEVRQRCGVPIRAAADRRMASGGSCAVHAESAGEVQASTSRPRASVSISAFQLTGEGIDEPIRALEQARREWDLRHHDSEPSTSGGRSAA